MNRSHWRIFKNYGYGDGFQWLVRSPDPEDIMNRFSTWKVAMRFAHRMAYGLSVMAHPFEKNERDNRCLICEEFEECHIRLQPYMRIN